MDNRLNFLVEPHNLRFWHISAAQLIEHEHGSRTESAGAGLRRAPGAEPVLWAIVRFSVDGTLIETWASQKSFRPKDGSGDEDGGANFHGQKRKNDTHA